MELKRPRRQTVYLHMRIDPDTKAKLMKIATKRRQTMSEVVRDLVAAA